ncbi:MAG: DNA primase large subunit PriL, partial [Euryarchaeota archaeon]|nr:DNA primase large subunit PriL [Euryarchaeota archaeon]
MDEYLALFPYTQAAATYVESSTRTFAALIAPGEFSNRVLQRSVERITWSIVDNIDQTEDKPSYPEAELFSYVMARVLVSCIHTPLLTQKYAAAEARHATYVLNQTEGQSQHDYLLRLLNDFQIDASAKNNAFHLHFTDVIKYTARLRGPEWRLVNLMNRGYIVLAKNQLIQLLAEVVRLKVLSGLPLKLDVNKCEALASYISALREIVSVKLSEDVDSDIVSLEACPPCIKALLLMVSTGRNLTHPARFALTSFLANIGMKAQDIVRIYEASPDFNEDLTEYQVDHIMGSSGKDYTPPGCSTMETYGNCVESDNLCKRVSHPLSYYRIKTKHRISSTTYRN